MLLGPLEQDPNLFAKRHVFVPTSWASDHPGLVLTAFIFSELVAVYCLAQVWRSSTRTMLNKLVWSVVLPVPFLGPLLFGGFA